MEADLRKRLRKVGGLNLVVGDYAHVWYGASQVPFCRKVYTGLVIDIDDVDVHLADGYGRHLLWIAVIGWVAPVSRYEAGCRYHAGDEIVVNRRGQPRPGTVVDTGARVTVVCRQRMAKRIYRVAPHEVAFNGPGRWP